VEDAAFSAVITLYNEEKNVEPLTRNLMAAFKQELSGRPFELVLVLNGPQDNTPEIARRLANEFSEISLVNLEENQGYGGGLLAGLSAARGATVGIFDGDEQIESADVAKIFSTSLSTSYDLVKAKRTGREDGIQRLFVSSIFNTLFSIMFGRISADINGKPKVLKRAAYERLNLTATDWFIDAEIMIQAARLGLSVKEVPVVFRRRKAGSSNVRLETLSEFLKNMWNFKNAKK
jgi:glycosyltransferase involved in cell wall biosynthesis